jgi:hypothetical protein
VATASPAAGSIGAFGTRRDDARVDPLEAAQVKLAVQLAARERGVQMLRRLDLPLGGVANRDQVVSRLRRAQDRPRHAVMFDDRAHLHVIRDHQPVEAQLLAQELADDGTRKRGRQLRVQPFDEHVRRHEGERILRIEELDKGPQVRLLELAARHLEHRQVDMRVDRSGALARKVLETASDAMLRVALHQRTRERYGAIPLRAERTNADARVGRVGLQVHDRREVEVEAHCRQLRAALAALRAGELDVVRRAERHVAGKDRRPFEHAHDGAALLIDGHEQGPIHHRADAVDQLAALRGVLDVPCEEDHRAGTRLVQDTLQRVARPGAVETDHQTASAAAGSLEGHARRCSKAGPEFHPIGPAPFAPCCSVLRGRSA